MSSSTFTKAEAEAKDVELAIEYDEWTGRIELKVKWVNKPGAGEGKKKRGR